VPQWGTCVRADAARRKVAIETTLANAAEIRARAIQLR
jgi:hypothetical protein